MTNKLMDPACCRRAFGVLLTRGRAIVLVKTAAELRDVFEDLLRTAEDLRVPLHTDWAGGVVELTVAAAAAGVPHDHEGRIEIMVRRQADALRGRIANLILHPFNVAPSEVYPVIAAAGGEVSRYHSQRPVPAGL